MTLVETLSAALRPDALFEGDAIEPRYLGDEAVKAAEHVRPLAVVRPSTTAEVALVMSACHAHGVPVVVQGGRTGLAGGATPGDGWVVLSLERLRAIGPVDVAAGVMTVEAGAVLQAVQDAACAAGLLFPLDIGARGSCTIGGNIATNAGGNRVLRYGMMRELVLGLEVVLPDGAIVSSLNTMLKNNAGYDLKQMFIGSEGTLGVVTQAVLRLFPRPTNTQTALCAVEGYGEVLELLQLAKARCGSNLAAFEVMWTDYYGLAGRAGLRLPLPPGAPGYVLVEQMGSNAPEDARSFEQMVADALEDRQISDAVIAHSERARTDFWNVRDSVSELSRTLGQHAMYDVSVPMPHVGEFVDECAGQIGARWAGGRVVTFGHVADCNVHIAVHVPGPAALPHGEIDDVIYACVMRHGGSISAEHGIGALKRNYLSHSRSAAEIALMAALKRFLDPRGILNPGKVLPETA